MTRGIRTVITACILAVLTWSGLTATANATESDFVINDSGELIKYQGDSNSIRIPDAVTSIGTGVFADGMGINGWGYASAEYIYIPDTVERIGQAAFSSSRLRELIVPDSVKKIDQGVCQSCGNLTTADLSGSGLTTIPSYAFRNCSLLSTVILGDNITSIGGGAFKNCTSLEAITLPEGLTHLGYGSFEQPFRGSGLKTIELNAGTLIPEQCFADCTNLTTVTLKPQKKGYRFIDSKAFQNCSNLTDVFFEGTEEEWNNSIIADDAFEGCGDFTIHYLGKSVKVSAIKPDVTDLTLKVGDSYQVTLTISPDNAANKSVKWTTGDSSIATVTQDGLITAKAEGGTAINIEAQDGSGVKGGLTVLVQERDPSEEPTLELDRTSLQMKKNQWTQLKVVKYPAGTEDSTIKWKTSDPEVAQIGGDHGRVTAITAKAQGNATITVYTTDGTELSATCEITVMDSEENHDEEEENQKHESDSEPESPIMQEDTNWNLMLDIANQLQSGAESLNTALWGCVNAQVAEIMAKQDRDITVEYRSGNDIKREVISKDTLKNALDYIRENGLVYFDDLINATTKTGVNNSASQGTPQNSLDRKVSSASSTVFGETPLWYISAYPGTLDKTIWPENYSNESGCGVAAMSTCLSSLGIRVEPKTVWKYNGNSVYMDGGYEASNYGIKQRIRKFDEAASNEKRTDGIDEGVVAELDYSIALYEQNPGTYSAPYISGWIRKSSNHYDKYSHFLVVTGKISENVYTIVDSSASRGTNNKYYDKLILGPVPDNPEERDGNAIYCVHLRQVRQYQK